MASPYMLTNADVQVINASGQAFQVFLAFLNPISIFTSWTELGQDSAGNWLPPPNYDTAANHAQPYAPTANLGSNRIGFVDEPLYFDGSRSCQRFDLPVIPGSYQWSVTGATSDQTLYDNGSQLSVTWAAPGIYTVSLSVADRAGTRTQGTRQVMIYQDRDTALPGVLQVSGLSGSLSNGGWQMQVMTLSSQWTLSPPESLPPGTYQPVVVLAETSWEVQPGLWVDRTIGPHGLFNPGAPYIDPRILFDGYVQQGSIHQDPDKDTLSFTCVGPQAILQEAKTHQLGYYNCSYTSIDTNGVPQGLNPSTAGNGYQVGNLTSADIIHSLLQTHSTIAQFHDLHIWNANIPTAPFQSGNSVASYNMIYTSLSVNEGTVWSNIGDIVANEWAQIYCERDGSIRVGPQTNYRGADYWQQPTLLGPTAAPALINVVQDLGYDVGVDLSTMTDNLPSLASQPFPVVFTHPWGHQQNPPQFLSPFEGLPSSSVVSTQKGLAGPPILCTFSDVPIYDTNRVAPDHPAIFPWILKNWPQDLSVYPFTYDITPIYTGRAALVKLIGTLQGHNAVWTSWDPISSFQVTSSGASVDVSVLPASDWVLDESHVLPDVTTTQNTNLVWNWWWEMPKRMRAAHNSSYQMQVSLGIFTAASLGDIVSVNRQMGTIGPQWSNKLFYVQEIDHSLDLTGRTWQTSLSLAEVTSDALGDIVSPPTSPPAG